MSDQSEWISVVVAAQQAGVPERSLARWVASGRVPSRKEGRARLVRLEDVAAAANGRASPASQPPAGKQPAGGVAGGMADGDLASRLFESLERGRTPAELVRTERVSPDVALRAFRDFQALREASGPVKPALALRFEAMEHRVAELVTDVQQTGKACRCFQAGASDELLSLDDRLKTLSRRLVQVEQFLRSLAQASTPAGPAQAWHY